MVDIPVLLEEKEKEKREKNFEQIMILLATNQRHLSDEEYKAFMANIVPKNTEEESQFSREKFEKLRLLTNMGANKSR